MNADVAVAGIVRQCIVFCIPRAFGENTIRRVPSCPVEEGQIWVIEPKLRKKVSGCDITPKMEGVLIPIAIWRALLLTSASGMHTLSLLSSAQRILVSPPHAPSIEHPHLLR